MNSPARTITIRSFRHMIQPCPSVTYLPIQEPAAPLARFLYISCRKEMRDEVQEIILLLLLVVLPLGRSYFGLRLL